MEPRAIAADHLRVVQRRFAELRKLERSLAGFNRDCDGVCA